MDFADNLHVDATMCDTRHWNRRWIWLFLTCLPSFCEAAGFSSSSVSSIYHQLWGNDKLFLPTLMLVLWESGAFSPGFYLHKFWQDFLFSKCCIKPHWNECKLRQRTAKFEVHYSLCELDRCTSWKKKKVQPTDEPWLWCTSEAKQDLLFFWICSHL